VRRFAIRSAALLLICASGCGRDETPPAPPAPPSVPALPPRAAEPAPKPPAAPPSPVVLPAEVPGQGKTESQYTGEEQAPAGLPDDVPLYAQATPISSMSSPQRGTIVNLRSGDPADAIFGWYQAELPKRGWILEKQSGAGGQHLLTALKGGRKATVMITTGASATQILLTVLSEH
jgi:hypothetical protein